SVNTRYSPRAKSRPCRTAYPLPRLDVYAATRIRSPCGATTLRNRSAVSSVQPSHTNTASHSSWVATKAATAAAFSSMNFDALYVGRTSVQFGDKGKSNLTSGAPSHRSSSDVLHQPQDLRFAGDRLRLHQA